MWARRALGGSKRRVPGPGMQHPWHLWISDTGRVHVLPAAARKGGASAPPPSAPMRIAPFSLHLKVIS